MPHGIPQLVPGLGCGETGQAQEAPPHGPAPDQFMLEAEISAGNEIACPGRYVAINGRVSG